MGTGTFLGQCLSPVQSPVHSNGRCSSAGPPAEDFVVPPVLRRKIWGRTHRRQSAGATGEGRSRVWGQARAGSNGRCSSAGPPAEDFVVPPVPPVPRRKIWARKLRRQSAGATAERRASAQVPVPSASSARSPSWIGDRHKRIHLVTGRWGQAQAQAQAHPDPSHTAQKNPQRKRPGERRLGFARIPQERIWWAADSATPALGLRWLTRGGAAPPARRGRARSVETLAPRCGERGLGRATRRTGRLAP